MHGWCLFLVNSGIGDGLYRATDAVAIEADPAPTGKDFDQWAGDVAHVADPYATATTVTMPASSIEVTAAYVNVLPGDLSEDGFVGQADLDIVLADWGGNPPLDPRADPSGDGFVGQADLDIVLADWGKSE